MKTFFGMTAAALLVVMMLFVALPENGEAGEIRNLTLHYTSCETTCQHGNKIRHCVRYYTYEEYEGIWPFGKWVQKQTDPEDIYENSGDCECDPLISLTCGQCKHCENWQCAPDPCKVSPSSPDDCPCVNQEARYCCPSQAP